MDEKERTKRQDISVALVDAMNRMEQREWTQAQVEKLIVGYEADYANDPKQMSFFSAVRELVAKVAKVKGLSPQPA